MTRSEARAYLQARKAGLDLCTGGQYPQWTAADHEALGILLEEVEGLRKWLKRLRREKGVLLDDESIRVLCRITGISEDEYRAERV